MVKLARTEFADLIPEDYVALCPDCDEPLDHNGFILWCSNDDCPAAVFTYDDGSDMARMVAPQEEPEESRLVH